MPTPSSTDMLMPSLPDHPAGAEVDLFALLCERRGWTPEFLNSIESAQHGELLSLSDMIDTLEQARLAGQRVTIATDFDMDGITSGVLGYAGLSELGFLVDLYVPDYRHGHDLIPEAIDEIARQFPDTDVLLTCDSGVNSHAGIAAAKRNGWLTLVTDHHQELPPGSQADITVNPCRIDETYELKGICGAHVLYQVLEAYTLRYQPTKHWEIRMLRLFAGLGTVSDVMPLVQENRQLVRDSLSIARLLQVPAPLTLPAPWGFDPDPDAIDPTQATLLQLLRLDEHHPVYLRAFEGFAALLKAFAQTGKLRSVTEIDESFYGFNLAPAMNAPRRTGDPLEPCFEVFTLDALADKLVAAHRVIQVNEQRKLLVAEHVASLAASDQPFAPWVFLAEPGIYPGMFGLLASKFMDQYGHPVVVLGRPTHEDQPLSGSGRAPVWCDIITELEPHAGLSAVGHQQACGVRVASIEQVQDLVAVLQHRMQQVMLEPGQLQTQSDIILGPDPDCDASLDDAEPVIELARRLEGMKPYGQGLPEPVIEVALDPALLRMDRIGSDKNCDHEKTDENRMLTAKGYSTCRLCKKHLRLILPSGIICLWWNAAEEHFDAVHALIQNADRTRPGTMRFTTKLQLNSFNGQTRVQAIVQEPITPAGAAHE